MVQTQQKISLNLIMLFIAVYFGLFITSVLCTPGDNLIKIAPDVKLFETPADFESPLGVVPGARSCGKYLKLT